MGGEKIERPEAEMTLPHHHTGAESNSCPFHRPVTSCCLPTQSFSRGAGPSGCLTFGANSTAGDLFPQIASLKPVSPNLQLPWKPVLGWQFHSPTLDGNSRARLGWLGKDAGQSPSSYRLAGRAAGGLRDVPQPRGVLASAVLCWGGPSCEGVKRPS